MWLTNVLAIQLSLAVASAVKQVGGSSQQVHLSLGSSMDEMTVTWSTVAPDAAIVRYWKYSNRSEHPSPVACTAASDNSNILWQSGVHNIFVDNGTMHHTQEMHRVTLDNLDIGSTYCYQVANGTTYSLAKGLTAPPFYGPKTYSFSTLKGDGSEWTNPRFTIFGDMGLENAESMPALTLEVGERRADVIVHTGDFAYDLYKDNATWGDRWLNFMEPVAAHQPYMTCIGNHEGMYDALNYRQRFSMPGQHDGSHARKENLFYSWDAGNTHWIAYDTEFYFTYEAMTDHGGVHRNFGPYPALAQQQLLFVENDLKTAAAPENRAKRPWIFVYGHRPMYCSDSDDDDCVKMNNAWRKDLESLFLRYGVDMVFEAHQHTYERLWPVFDSQVYNGTSTPGQPYTNPQAPVHIVSGSAGCDENLDRFNGALGPWSAVRDMSYGYGHLDVKNATHVHWEQLYAGNRSVTDSIWLIKDQGHMYPHTP